MTSRVPLAGVIGTSVQHSKSPKLQNFWLSQLGIQGHYVPMNIAQDDLAEALKMLPKLGFVGLNVTIPHKERVLALADQVTDRAAVIGAANTLIFREDGTFHADNTDGFGFTQNLKTGAPNWDASTGPAAVFGAGGASRAVIASLIDQGVPEIRLSNRTRTRADALRTEFGTKIEVYDWVQAGNMIEGCATVVNTTSQGMHGQAELKVPLDALRPDMVVNDLVYTPLETGLLKTAKDAGCTVVDGLGMLLHQAVPGFERWFGARPEVDDIARSLLLGE